MADPIRRTLTDLQAKGAPAFFERSPAALKSAMKSEFETVSGRTLYPAQTEMFLIEVAAYALSILNEAAQTAVLQNTAVFASGVHLENRGANVSTFRLLPQFAKTTLRFTLSAVRLIDVAIPAGTRAASGAIVFATDADLVIPAGMTAASVTATATAAGAASNGLAIGAVSDLLDPIAYVSTVRNTVTVSGGTDIEEEERFRLRVVNALFTISKTGPRNGYREHVMAVDPEIVDVAVVRPEPGKIQIFPLMRTGAPSGPLKMTVFDYLDPETLRPMGDDVAVLSPEEVAITVTLTVRTAVTIAGMQARAIAAARAAFEPWTQTLGSQVAPSVLVSAIKALDGVVDVSVAGFGFTDLQAHQYASLSALTVNVVVTADV